MSIFPHWLISMSVINLLTHCSNTGISDGKWETFTECFNWPECYTQDSITFSFFTSSRPRDSLSFIGWSIEPLSPLWVESHLLFKVIPSVGPRAALQYVHCIPTSGPRARLWDVRPAGQFRCDLTLGLCGPRADFFNFFLLRINRYNSWKWSNTGY